MPRCVYLLGVGLALVALALAVTDWMLTPPPGVTEANVKRIRPGMTLAEVESILGGPGDRLLLTNREKAFTARGLLYFWAGDAGSAWVVVTEDGRVHEAEWVPDCDAQPGSFARLRAWLGG
jgi:hypothetical protein